MTGTVKGNVLYSWLYWLMVLTKIKVGIIKTAYEVNYDKIHSSTDKGQLLFTNTQTVKMKAFLSLMLKTN